MQKDEMTVYQWMKNQLTEKGMFDDDAAAIIAEVKPQMEEADRSMHERWDDPIKNYVLPIRGIWLIWLDSAALQWLNENKPNHWARPLFMRKAEREKFFKDNNIEV